MRSWSPRSHRCARRALVFALVAGAFAFVAPAIAAIPQSERDALLALYANTDGPHWRHQDRWNGAPGTECSWYRVVCDTDETHVILISLGDNALRGELPSLTALTELEAFIAYGNQLTGAPPSFSGMQRLETIALGMNALSGPIPPMTDLPALKVVSFEFNHLTGSIPALDLPSLESFYVPGNELTGPLPSLAHTPNLDTFVVSGNALTGALPSLAGLPRLTWLNVSYNQLSGHLPAAPTLDASADVALCPNAFEADPDPAWDFLTGNTPWYVGCNGVHVNLNQSGIGGTWYNPASSGQGILLTAWPDLASPGHGVVFGGWFTFTPQADPEPTTPHWFSFQGDVDTQASEATFGLYETHGGHFAAPPLPTTQQVGLVDLVPVDCWHGSLRYHFDDRRVPDGIIPIRRLIANANCTLDGDAPPPTDNSRLSGAWYDPSLTGQGLIIDVSPAQTTLFAAWYTFVPGFTPVDPQHELQWYYLQAVDVAPDATTFTNVPIYQPPPGVFLGPQTAGDTRVGHADFVFEGCDALTLTYRFNASAQARTLNLVRLGPSPPACR